MLVNLETVNYFSKILKTWYIFKLRWLYWLATVNKWYICSCYPLVWKLDITILNCDYNQWNTTQLVIPVYWISKLKRNEASLLLLKFSELCLQDNHTVIHS